MTPTTNHPTQALSKPKPLPSSEALERACLGALLLSPDLFKQLRVGPEDFFYEFHRKIWLAMDALHEEGEPIDIRTLQEVLLRRGEFEQVGGLAYLACLDQDLPSLDHVEIYARRLREYRRFRERILAGERYLGALYEAGEDIPAREEEVRRLLQDRDPDDGNVPMAIDVEAFLALSFPPRQWLVEGLIQQKDAGMIHAWRGVGKTHFVLSLTWALVSGGRFLSFSVPEPAGVLVIDGEMPREDLQRRLARIVKDSEVRQRQAPLRILAADMFDTGLPSLATSSGQAIVEANLCAFPEVKVVIVDNISTLCSAGLAENEAESWNGVQEFVLKLRRRGISVVFVHHSNKGLSQRGTSKREDILSWVLDLRRPEDYRDQDGARFEMRFSKARAIYGEAAQPLDVQLIDTPGGGLDWTWRPVESAEPPQEPAPSKEQGLALLEAGQSADEVAQALGVHRATVFRWKKELATGEKGDD